eukprot:767700-Hanusia_phi.AAC.2
MATFSDLEFKGHPGQQYNMTFSISDLGNSYVPKKTFHTSWVITFEDCPAGQIGTWDRSCECAKGYEPGGASGCQRCDGGQAKNEGGQSDEPGSYKATTGQASCTKCPSQNMITINSTTRDSVGTCFCSSGYFRAAIIYDYNASYTPTVPNGFDVAAAGAGDELCGGPGSSQLLQSNGNQTSILCLESIEFQSVDCGRVRGHIVNLLVSVKVETGGACNQQYNPKICTACKSKTGCRGDSFGVGTQGCNVHHRGVMCQLCERGFYLSSGAACVKCPSQQTYALTFGLGAFGLLIGGFIAIRYLALIKLLADPPSVKIFAAYLIITSSISSSYDVQLPSSYSSYQSQTGFAQLDITGVLYCIIQSFEYTFYHNVVLQASLPFMIVFLAQTALTIRYSMISTHFAAKRKADRKGLNAEKINTQENSAKTNIKEMIISGSSQVLMFIHPTVTTTMFSMFSCTPIFGYNLPWLRIDVRYQCYDASPSLLPTLFPSPRFLTFLHLYRRLVDLLLRRAVCHLRIHFWSSVALLRPPSEEATCSGRVQGGGEEEVSELDEVPQAEGGEREAGGDARRSARAPQGPRGGGGGQPGHQGRLRHVLRLRPRVAGAAVPAPRLHACEVLLGVGGDCEKAGARSVCGDHWQLRQGVRPRVRYPRALRLLRAASLCASLQEREAQLPQGRRDVRRVHDALSYSPALARTGQSTGEEGRMTRGGDMRVGQPGDEA